MTDKLTSGGIKMRYSAILFFILVQLICTDIKIFGAAASAVNQATEAAQVTVPEENEDFKFFLHQFAHDTLFQVSRIKFPLPSETFSEDGSAEIDTIYIQKKNWEFISLIDNEYITTVYDNFNCELRDTGERVLAFEGLASGVLVRYYFKLIDKKWFLVKTRDLSM